MPSLRKALQALDFGILGSGCHALQLQPRHVLPKVEHSSGSSKKQNVESGSKVESSSKIAPGGGDGCESSTSSSGSSGSSSNSSSGSRSSKSGSSSGSEDNGAVKKSKRGRKAPMPDPAEERQAKKSKKGWKAHVPEPAEGHQAKKSKKQGKAHVPDPADGHQNERLIIQAELEKSIRETFHRVCWYGHHENEYNDLEATARKAELPFKHYQRQT